MSIQPTKLLPCPFCGSSAKLTRNNFGRDGIICYECGADMRYNGVEDDGFPELIKAWNKRTPLQIKELDWIPNERVTSTEVCWAKSLGVSYSISFEQGSHHLTVATVGVYGTENMECASVETAKKIARSLHRSKVYSAFQTSNAPVDNPVDKN